MKTILLGAFLATTIISAATSAEFSLEIEKRSNLNIRSIRVEGGEVSGLPEGKEPDKFSVSVRLPDGVCVAHLTVFYNNQATALRSDSDLNFCTVHSITISRSRY